MRHAATGLVPRTSRHRHVSRDLLGERGFGVYVRVIFGRCRRSRVSDCGPYLDAMTQQSTLQALSTETEYPGGGHPVARGRSEGP